MKRLISKIFTKNTIKYGFAFVITTGIWFCGPLLVIANQFPLQTAEKRFYLIALSLFAWWLFCSLFLSAKKIFIMAPKTAEAKNRLQALHGRFLGAMRFLKKTQITKHNKNVNLAQLPWCLLIGPQGAGKTTLLANANVSYILTKQFKQEKIVPSETTDWWVTRDLVLVDVPGFYLGSKYNYLWESFINLTLNDVATPMLSTVIVALPLPDLLKQENPQQQKQMIADLKLKISQLREKFGQKLNFYFVITKCDLLPGFIDFFNEYSTEESTQAWGITLPIPKENEKLLDIFSQRFNALIKRLNSQLIYRLHHERNSAARSAIKDFPLQLERLKDMTAHILKSIAPSDLYLHGIYLTSGTQLNTDDQLAQAQIINPNAHQSLQLLRHPPVPAKPYFIRQLILQGILSTAEQVTPKTKNHYRWLQYSAYAASVGAIITAAIFLGRDFQQSVLLTYSIQNNLAQYQLAIQQHQEDGDHLVKALPLLNALQTTATRTNTKLSKLANILSFYSDKSQKTASVVYQQALQTIVLPEIKNVIESYLKNSADKNPTETYGVLKVYLMLGNTQNIKTDAVVNTLKRILANNLSTQANNDLMTHVQAAFDHLTQPIELNNELIAKVRIQLMSLQPQDLALVILKNMNNNNLYSTIQLGLGNPSIFANKSVTNQIPILFTQDVFTDVLSQELPVAASEALQGNDILGKAEILSNDATINTLVEQLRTRYISSYVETWENMLGNLKITTPTSLAQTDSEIVALMGNSSPLLQLLNTINSNTSFVPIMNASPKLHALNALLANAHNEQENTLYQVFVDLRQLHLYLQNILSATDAPRAAFAAAKTRMQDPTSDPITQLHLLAEQNPEPMRSWLNNLAAQSWSYILLEASHYIENAWQVNIYMLYHTQIHDPVNQDFDVQQFASFVGKSGTLASFYQDYLKPFVADDGKQWQWRVVDNQKIPLDNSALAEIQQASRLQRMSKYALFTQARNNPEMQNFTLPEKLADKT